jgi:hypothetical protein
MTDTLFELELELEVECETDDPLRDDDTASTSCRYCQMLTTAAGIDNRGHGPDSSTCARYLTWGYQT